MEANIEQDNKKADSSQERGTGGAHEKRASLQENEVNRTRSGWHYVGIESTITHHGPPEHHRPLSFPGQLYYCGKGR